MNYSFRLAPAYCLYNGTAVYEQNGAEITFLIENPENAELEQRLKRAFCHHLDYVGKQNDCPENYKNEMKVMFKKCSRTELKKCVAGEMNEGASVNVAEKTETYKGNYETENSAATVLLDSILSEAREKMVTDVHIEGNAVRFRTGGKLEKQMILSDKNCGELVQKVKLICGMNVIENRKSQDGQFISNKEKGLFVRVSSLPVFSESGGSGYESIVMRLLDMNRMPLKTGALGFNEKQQERLRLLEETKDGLVLICGPTGAGKSTTAGSFLLEMNEKCGAAKKIISLEDPPEFVIPGVTQVRIDDERKNSFENLLNHIFRQDPDVIMIGEIRDEKSAAAALRASLTGHLVVATLHTGSASGAMLRLENLGLDRKLLASVLRGVIVQELEYLGKEPVLLAEIDFPCEGFCEKLKSDMGQTAIENMFDFESNGSEVLEKTIKLMKMRQVLSAESDEAEALEVIEEERLAQRIRAFHKRRAYLLPGFGTEAGGDSGENGISREA